MSKLLLTPAEAAEALGIGRTKVYELIVTNTLGSVKIGSCRRIPVGALDEYVQTLRTGAAAGAGGR